MKLEIGTKQLIITLAVLIAGYSLFAAGSESAHATEIPEQFIGNPSICPRWALEPWVWEDNGNTEESVLDLVKGYKERNIPAGVVIIDSPWETAYNSFEWDTTRYPNPQEMIDQLRADNVRVIMWITGAMNDSAGDVPIGKAPDFDDVIKNGLTVNDGKTFEWWKGTGVHIDFTKKEACDWFGSRIDKIMEMGIDGWKVDQAEHYLEDSVNTSIGSISKDAFKPYYYAAVHDQSLKNNPESLILARPYSFQGGFAASINKCTVGWGGDFMGNWKGLQNQAHDLYKSATAGYGVLCVEVGGYEEPAPSKESLLRYTQFGALMPVMNNGGSNGGLKEHLPWFWDEETVEIFRYYAVLHSELVPYIFSCSVNAHLHGGSIVKSADIEKAHHRLGEQLFTSLIFSEKNQKAVDLPKENLWIDYWNEDQLLKPDSAMTVNVPLDKVPLYVKAGAIIPMNVRSNVTGHGDDSSQDKSTILVYPHGTSSYLYHCPLGNGIQYTDIQINMDESSGILSVKGDKSVSYRFRIKCFSKPSRVKGCDSWKYDASNQYIIADKEGASFMLNIDKLSGYSVKTANRKDD